MRSYALNRWNWSERAKKWVFVQKTNGKRKYKYKLSPPSEFENYTFELRKLNQNLMREEDPDRQIEIFKQLMGLSQKMQSMRD